MNLAYSISLYCRSKVGWTGFDLDGTLAKYTRGQDINTIGVLIDGDAADELKKLLKKGEKCKVVTARVGPEHSSSEIRQQTKLIQNWTKKNFGKKLEVVNGKDHLMVRLYDDKAVGIKNNTGELK